ncbi:metal ABC transporter permease, partial [bacterium]|nr:metal ABC transporter permease [bacterium]
MIEFLASQTGLPQFLVLAFLAGSLVALLSAFYGVFVVQRSLGFLGNGLAHAAFGGVALGILLGVEPLAVALPFTIAISAGIVWLREHSRLGADTIIGIFFSVSMALGILLLSKTPRFNTDAFAYLFGSILSVRPMDLLATCGAALVTLACAPLWGRWAYATFDRELALADKIPSQRDDYILSACLALVIVVAMKVVGITLIAAFLVIPPAAAR